MRKIGNKNKEFVQLTNLETNKLTLNLVGNKRTCTLPVNHKKTYLRPRILKNKSYEILQCCNLNPSLP